MLQRWYQIREELPSVLDENINVTLLRFFPLIVSGEQLVSVNSNQILVLLVLVDLKPTRDTKNEIDL